MMSLKLQFSSRIFIGAYSIFDTYVTLHIDIETQRLMTKHLYRSVRYRWVKLIKGITISHMTRQCFSFPRKHPMIGTFAAEKESRSFIQEISFDIHDLCVEFDVDHHQKDDLMGRCGESSAETFLGSRNNSSYASQLTMLCCPDANFARISSE